MMLLWLALALPSTFIVHKFLGWPGVAAYLAGSAIAVRWWPALPARWSDRRLDSLAVATLAVVALIFALVHPVVDTRDPFTGSDDDEAYDVGVAALLAGRSPYGSTTYLGNVLHQLPGAFVLAAPFTLLGTSALQNPFWLAIFFLVLRREAGRRTALRIAWMTLLLSPVVLHGVVTGTAHIANTIYVALGLWWLSRTRMPALASVAWGVTLASRANFLMLLPLAYGWLIRARGWRAATGAVALAAGTASALSLPFYLHDPAAFGPLEAADRLTRFDDVLPHSGLGILLAMAALSCALGATGMDRPALFRNAAVVQAVPIVAGLALSAAMAGVPDLRYAAYGTFFAWFAFLAVAGREGSATGTPMR